MLTPGHAHTGERCKQTLQCIEGDLVRLVQTDLNKRLFWTGTKENPGRRRLLSTTERGAPGHTCHGIGSRVTQTQPHLPSVSTKEQDNTDTRVASEKQLLQPAQSFISAGKHCFFFFSLGFHWCLCGCYSLLHSLKSFRQ